MIKADLVGGIAEKLEVPKKTVTAIVEEVFNSIEATLAKDATRKIPQKSLKSLRRKSLCSAPARA